MKRLVIVYNPSSSQYRRVKSEVLSVISSFITCPSINFEVKKIDFSINVANLSQILRNDDLVLSAGGDATAAIAANAILKSTKNVTLAVLPYGNFNDLARTLRTFTLPEIFNKNPQNIKKLYPLEIIVDGKFWRYATCYVTIGMTAEAVELFDDDKVRKELQKGHKSSWRSYLHLMDWYFRNRHKKIFLPNLKLNGKKMPAKTSDYAALSGSSMCRVMKGRKDYLKPKCFRSLTAELASFPRLFVLMTRSILCRTPGKDTDGDVLEFTKPTTVEIQAEGEYQIFENTRKIEIKKGKQCLQVIQN